jgi:outer membrane lipase/esterase
MKRESVVQSLLFACALLLSVGAAAHQPFKRIVVVGDSLSDAGNAFVITHQVSVPPYDLIPDAPYARGGLHFSNGPTWIEQLARELHGFQGVCASLPAPRVCTDYAVGGAVARAGAPFNLEAQVLAYLGDFHGSAADRALHVVFIGGNDLRDALTALQTDTSGQTSALIIGDALQAIANNIITLASAGAREFLVANAPNLGLVPAVRLQGPQAQFVAQVFSKTFNDTLAGLLFNLENGLQIKIHRMDVFSLVNAAVANPAAYGLTEVETTCITPGVKAHAVCKHPEEYLFWDGIHPTRAGHAILAREAKAVLGLP